MKNKEDISLLVKYFINKYNQLHNKQVKGISDELLAALANFEWPRNVGGLESFIDHAVALSTDSVLSLPSLDIPNVTFTVGTWAENIPPNLSLDEVESGCIKRVFKACNNNYVEAAKILKINKSTLYRKLGKPQK
jgi:transcriptional regulator with PAS, ATPase and Fis domain